MRVLLLGDGATLHVLAWKMASERAVVDLYCAPGNAGTALLLGTAPFDHHETAEIAQWAFAQQVDLVVVQGRPDWVEALTGVGLPLLGAGPQERQALRLRQDLRDRLGAYNIPQPPGQAFREREAAERYLASRPLPLRLRPNEAAEGEVVLVRNRLEAFEQLARLLALHPEEGVYIEQEVGGLEVALGLLNDGQQAVSLGVSRPYYRRYEEDKGPLTEGMGAYAPYGDAGLEERLLAAVGRPLVAALRAEGVLRPGFLHLRIVLGPDGPLLRDLAWDLDELYAAVTLPRWAGEAAGILQAAAGGRLEETAVPWKPGLAVAVALVAQNYPGGCPGGHPLDSIHDTPAMAWHHATRLQATTEPASIWPAWLRSPATPQTIAPPGQVVTTGGRALFVVGYADSAYEACQQAYQGVAQLAFEYSAWRRDIAAELL